jgi:hypothetical protein
MSPEPEDLAFDALELPGMPAVDSPTPYELAQMQAIEALELTQKRLAVLREGIKLAYDEVRLLVEEEELLTRMTKVRKGARKPRT